MAFKDSRNRKIVKAKIVITEKAEDYKTGIEELIQEGGIIEAIVCDGKKREKN